MNVNRRSLLQFITQYDSMAKGIPACLKAASKYVGCGLITLAFHLSLQCRWRTQDLAKKKGYTRGSGGRSSSC